MSADKRDDIEMVEPKITIDDVKRRAEAVRDLAVSEVKRTTDEVLHEQVTRTIVVGVVAVVTAVSFAFFLGSRRGRASVKLPPLPPYHSFPSE